MDKIYLNHQVFLDSIDLTIHGLIIELVELKNILGLVSLRVSCDFWGLPVQSEKLNSYLEKRKNMDRAIVTILTLMNNGPFFFYSDRIHNLVIVPVVSEGSFPHDLMHICFKDKQEYVLSLSNEKILVNESYLLAAAENSFDLRNFIGKQSVLEYLKNSLVFNSIEEVFDEITRSNPEIIILDSARKSAKKHNFKGAFTDVYRTICALVSEKLLLIEGIPDAIRVEAFLQKTHYEISGEGKQTLNNPKYKKYRQFVIPAKGNFTFEWHIKIGSEIRIHYYIDIKDNKIYIGHCGCHLPVISYRS